MSFMEVILTAWICDLCGIECLSGDDSLPEGWVLSLEGDRHACAVCLPADLISGLRS